MGKCNPGGFTLDYTGYTNQADYLTGLACHGILYYSG